MHSLFHLMYLYNRNSVYTEISSRTDVKTQLITIERTLRNFAENSWRETRGKPSKEKKIHTMKKIFVFCCIGLIINIPDTYSTYLTFPNITCPQNNSSLDVKSDSQFVLDCTANLGYKNICSTDIAVMFWLINGNITNNFTNIQEDDFNITAKDELCYIHVKLHVLKMVPAFYDIPFTCMVQSISGSDEASMYLRKPHTSGNIQVSPYCAVEEEHHILTCTLQTSTHFNILKNEGHLIYWYKKTTFKEKIHISAEATNRIINKGLSLEFWPITLNDSGTYYCTFQNETHTIDLQVRKKRDHCIDSPCQREQKSIEGRYVKIQLHLDEYNIMQNTSIVWYKECQLYSTSKNVEFFYVQKSDEGNYTFVIVTTHRGKKYNISRKTRLLVEEPQEVLQPHLNGLEENKTEYVELGQNLTLECDVVFANKECTLLYWLYGENFVKSCKGDIKTQCEVQKESNNSMSSELQLINITEDDIKLPYTCKLDICATNKWKQFTLKLKEKTRDISEYEFTTSMVTSVTCSICIIIVMVLWFWFRIDIILQYRKITGKDETIEDGKEYDAYLSFLNNSITEFEEESKFAFHVLPTVMENHFGYKLCIRERDALPGGAIVDDVHLFLEKSRRLIILLSKNYVSDKIIYELESGLYKAMVERKIKVILIEYVSLCELNVVPESLKLLKASERVRWEGDRSQPLKSRFWKKIQYLMPVKPINPSMSLSKVEKSTVY